MSLQPRLIRLLCLPLVAGALALILIASGVFKPAAPVTASVRPDGPPGRPNILLLVSDDQRYDQMLAMPHTLARIYNQGVGFDKAYVSTPMCCPSRASILTGQYAHNDGVGVNEASLFKPTWVEALHNSGYFTGLVGKYLNSWDGTPRPEFNFWVSWPLNTPRYMNPLLNVNGDVAEHAGYQTTILNDYAAQFIDQAASSGQPWALMYTPLAPHAEAIAAPGDGHLYFDLPLTPAPSVNEEDMSDKPAWLQKQQQVPQSTVDSYILSQRRQLQALNGLDNSFNDILDDLQRRNMLDNTLIIFLSDNGVFWGEHRLAGKDRGYEEATHVPMAIRYPPLVADPGRTDHRLVSNIDIAPTIYELAGLPIPADVDGKSLVPVLSNQPTDWRDYVLLEGWRWNNDVNYKAIHTDRYEYIETTWDRSELYDLQTDPYQLQNVIDDPSYGDVLAALRSRMEIERSKMPVDDTAYGVSIGSWLAVNDDRASRYSYHVSNVPNARVIYRDNVTNTRISLVSYRGPDQGIVKVKIDDQDYGIVDLYSPTPEFGYTVTYDNLPATRHQMVLNISDQKNPLSSGTEVRIDAFDTDNGRVEDHTTHVFYGGWSALVNTASYDLRYRLDNVPETISYTFTGTEISLITALCPDCGMVDLVVDGQPVRTVDLYAAEYQWQHEEKVDGLTPGQHTFEVDVLKQHNPASPGSHVLVDGFRVGPVPPLTALPLPTEDTPTPTATPTPVAFIDVDTEDFFYEPVQYLAAHGIISGYADGSFRPFSNTIRGQLAKIMVLSSNQPIDTVHGPHFTDVPVDNPFYKYVETMYNLGLVSGYADGTFHWNAEVTRGQLTKFVVAANNWSVTPGSTQTFTDVPPSNPFFAEIETAVAHGVISGYADGTFRWNRSATRGQIAKVVYLASSQ